MTVTRRKHVDWEIMSSMIDSKLNKKSGILVVTLPSINCSHYNVSHEGEKENIYPDTTSWTTINNRSEYESRYPYLPDRIIDNLLKPEALVSVTNWDRIYEKPAQMKYLIDVTYSDRQKSIYDTSRQMRRNNS